MKLNSGIAGALLAASFLSMTTVPVMAQVEERICRSDYHVDSTKVGELSVELDNISFFKDNEFTGSVMKGYTLPGMWLQPKAVFYPLHNMKMELGMHALIYDGAYKYPNYAYQDIAEWKGGQYQKGFHLLPFFRAQLALPHVNFVFGDIYGGDNHRLILPLYNPELNLTSDPEMGFQILFDATHWHLDSWVNWQSFIFNDDTHHEAFTFGLSSFYKLNDEESKVHTYFPLQITIQHRGGEQDTVSTNRVQTLMNGSIGGGLTWNTGCQSFKHVNLEAHLLGYYQQSGHKWPLTKGWAWYTQATVDLGSYLRFRAGYFYGDNFISLFGIPYFGTVSTNVEGAIYDRVHTGYLSFEYSHTFARHFAFGVKANAYLVNTGAMTRPDGTTEGKANSTNFAFGAYLRMNPSFLLKKFKL